MHYQYFCEMPSISCWQVMPLIVHSGIRARVLFQAMASGPVNTVNALFFNGFCPSLRLINAFHTRGGLAGGSPMHRSQSLSVRPPQEEWEGHWVNSVLGYLLPSHGAANYVAYYPAVS